VIHRLSRQEYNLTIRDLLGVDTHPADQFPPDGGGGAGFDNNASTLFVPPILMEKFLSAAGQIVAAAKTGAALPLATGARQGRSNRGERRISNGSPLGHFGVLLTRKKWRVCSAFTTPRAKPAIRGTTRYDRASAQCWFRRHSSSASSAALPSARGRRDAR
jgi:hypothetical protein